MNRRDWMKLIAAGTPAALMYPVLENAEPAEALFIVTDDPRWAVSVACGAQKVEPSSMRITSRPITPSRQDLTIIRGAQIVDPRRSTAINPSLIDLASNLRSRQSLGTHLVSIEPRAVPADGNIVFECDGRTVESIPRRASFRRISIPGERGETVFSLDDGALSVVSSSCRHELCKRSGPIRAGRIICAPNRLVVTVGRRPLHQFDAITG